MTLSKNSDGEIRIFFKEFKNITSCVEIELRDFFLSCITNDFLLIGEIEKKIRKKNVELFIGVSMKKSPCGRDKWKACSVKTNTNENGERKIRVFACSHDVDHEDELSAFDNFREIFDEFHQSCDDDGSDSIIDALKSIDVFSHDTLESMATIIIETGLNYEFLTKSPVERFVGMLNASLSEGHEVQVNEKQLNNLVHILTSRNFEKIEPFAKNVPLETLKIFKVLKIKNLANFSETNAREIREFLTKHRLSYRSAIESSQEVIKKDPRNKHAISAFRDALQGRVDFLTCVALFSSVELNNSDLAEVLKSKNFCSKALNDQMNEAKILREKIDEIKANCTTETSASESLKLVNKLSDLKVVIIANMTIANVKNKLKIDEFIVEYERVSPNTDDQESQGLKAVENKSKLDANKWTLVATKCTLVEIKNYKDKFTTEFETIRLLLEYIDKCKLSKIEARAILSILLQYKKKFFDDIPVNIIDALNDDDNQIDYTDRKSVISFGLDKQLKKPKNYVEFLTKSLTEHGSLACTALKKYKDHLDDYGKLGVDLFEAIIEIDKMKQIIAFYGTFWFLSNLDDMKKSRLTFVIVSCSLYRRSKVFDAYKTITKMLRAGQKIPTEAFKTLTYAVDCPATYSLIRDILEDDNQEIPSDVVVEIINLIKISAAETTADQLNVINMFLERGLVAYGDIEQFLLGAMIEGNKTEEIKADEVTKKELFRSSGLKMIYNAKQLGQSISSKTMNFLSNLSSTKENANTIKYIVNSESELIKLTRGKTNAEEKLRIFDCIEENFSNFSDIGSVKTLIDVVLYDETVSKRAFEVLMKVLPANFSFKNHELCNFIIQLLWCDVEINDVEEFLLRLKTNFKEVLEACKQDVMKEKLNEALKFADFTEMTREKLQEVLKKNKNLSNSNISMIIDALNVERYSEFHESISSSLKAANEQQMLSESNHRKIKSILTSNLNHPQFNELLEILPKDLKETLKSDPIAMINENIEKLELDNTNHEIIEILSKEFLSKLTEEDVNKLQKVCINICQSIKDCEEEQENIVLSVFSVKDDKCNSSEVKNINPRETLKELSDKQDELFLSLRALMKILSHHASSLENAETFLGDILKFIISNLNMNEDIESLITDAFLCQSPCATDDDEKNPFNTVSTLNFITALLYVKINKTEIRSQMFKEFTSDRWSVELLISTLISMCVDNNEFYLEDLLQTFKRDLKVKLYDLLCGMIDMNEGISIDLNECIDLITIISSDEGIFKRYLNAEEPQRLYEMWLKNKLTDKYDEECEVQGLKSLMIYQPKVIEMLLRRDNQNPLNVRDFVRIFRTLQQCSSISHVKKITKLHSITNNESTTWLPTVELFLIDDLLMTKFKEAKMPKLKKLRIGLQRIYHIGWKIDSIVAIINRLKPEFDVKQISKALRPIHEYKINELSSNVKGEVALETIITCKNFNKIMEIVKHNSFDEAREKSVQQLCEEIASKNPDVEFARKLLQEYETVKAAYEEPSSILPNKTIKDLDKEEITEWALMFKKDKRQAQRIDKLLINLNSNRTTQLNVVRGLKVDPPLIYEQIAVLMRALKLFKDYEPRPVQILSLLLLLNPSEGQGRLAQINTGEGKTTIVAMLAVIKALAGHTVDVITSSPELAKPQAEELSDFYKMFGLTVCHNADDAVEKAIRYKCDIVYGAATDFQGDILRDEYSKLGTRSGRVCDYAIVDEVDSMLIDSRNHIVMLSTSMPAMNYLEPFYAAIWLSIRLFAQSIKEIEGKFYFVQKEPITDEGEVDTESREVEILIEGSKENLIKKDLLERIKEKVDAGDLKVPTHLKELILNGQLDRWINSAVFGKYHSKKDQNYILSKGKVVPVDSDNTGVLQQNMNWTNGLHQFLQIKHGAKITPESLTTNYISNVALFRRYGENLFGLTGTLGSKSAHELLQRTYNVDNVIIPPFMVKRFKELSAIVVEDEEDWYDEIVESNMLHLENKRAVLIITKYISEADKLHARFTAEFNQRGMKKEKIRLYKIDHESDAVKNKVTSGDLIIATNIAGRGTDIKTSEIVEAHGGLHVCITSLPSNERVEQQNVGRTSRTGNLGTSQFIIQHSQQADIEFFKSNRDTLENLELMRAEEGLAKTLQKDEIFAKFCKLLKIVPRTTIKKAVEDRFGIFLQIHSESIDKVEEEFKAFEKSIRDDLISDCVIKNPSYYVLIGNEYLEIKEYGNAIYHYSKAINLEAEFSEIAYYNRGYARLTLHSNDASNKKSEINEAIEDLKEALKRIKNREMELHLIQTAKEGDENILSEQVSHKMNLYAMQKGAIEHAIGPDKDEFELSSESMNSKLMELEEMKKGFVNAEANLNAFKKANYKLVENYESRLKKLEGMREKLVTKKKNLSEIDKLLSDFKLDNKQYEELLEHQKSLQDIDQQIKDMSDRIKESTDNFNKNEGGAVMQALNKNRDLKVELKTIEKSLPSVENAKYYEDEIKEFAENGFLGGFSVSEIEPINWWSVIGVLALGIGQAVLGGALCIFTLGAGSAFGMTFLTEGISDILTAVKDGIINRTFSWVEYGIQKAISYVASILCMGLSAIKDAAKTAYAGVKGAFATMTTVTKKGWILVTKKIGLEVTKKIGTEIVNELVNIGVDMTLIPQIESAIKDLIEPDIVRALQENKTVHTWLKIDADNRNKVYETIILRLASEILSKENDKGALRRIAEGIADRVLSQAGIAGKLYTYLKQACNFAEIVTFKDLFLEELKASIKQEAQQHDNKNEETGVESNQNEGLQEETNVVEDKPIKQEAQQHDNKNKESGVESNQNERFQEETNTVEDETIKVLSGHHEPSEFDEFMGRGKNDSKNTQNDDQPEEQVKVQKDYSNSSDVHKNIAETVSQTITSIIIANYVKPFTCSLVDKGINGVTKGLSEGIENQVNSYKCERRTEFRQNKDRDNRVPDEHNQAHNDEEVKKAVEQEIKNFKDGNEKVGLQDLGSVSDACGCAIRVLDENGNLMRIIGDEKGKVVEVKYKDGHYSSPDGSDPKGSEKPNDCLFNVIAHQLGEKDPQKIVDMRSKTAEAMKNNAHILANQYHDVQYLKAHDRSVLHEGGKIIPTRQNVEDFINKLKFKGNEKFLEGAYRYGEIEKILSGRYTILEIHHEPPDASYKGDSSNKLCIVLDYSDHRNLLSTDTPGYVASVRNIINLDKVNGFANAVFIGCLDIQLTSLKSGNGTYGSDMFSLIDGHLKNKKISSAQAEMLKEKVKNFPTKIENFTPEYLNSHKDSFKNGDFAFSKFEAKLTGIKNTDPNPKKTDPNPKKTKRNRFNLTVQTDEKIKKQKREDAKYKIAMRKDEAASREP